LVVVWLVSGSFFFSLMPSKMRKQFFSFETGWQYTLRYFREGDDTKKREIFEINHRQWRSIRHEVSAWTKANWVRWKTEQPEWFSADWIALVDDEFIPVQLDAARPRRTSLSASVASLSATKPKLEDDEYY